METEIKKELNCTSLIVKAEEAVSSYETKMFLSCRIKGLLSCNIRHVDNRSVYAYDITGKKSLASLCESREPGLDELRWILAGILRVPSEMEEYLLSADRLTLDPKLIYLDMAQKEVLLLFRPSGGKDFSTALREMTEYLLPRIDREDNDAVMFGYRFYRLAMEKETPAEHLAEFLAGDSEAILKDSVTILPEDATEEYGEEEEALYNPEEETSASCTGGRGLFKRNGRKRASEQNTGRGMEQNTGRAMEQNSGRAAERNAGRITKRNAGRASEQGGWKEKFRMDRRTLLMIGGGLMTAFFIYTVLHSGILEDIDPTILIGAALAAVSAGALIGFRVVRRGKEKDAKQNAVN